MDIVRSDVTAAASEAERNRWGGCKRISWGAIFGGTFFGLGIMITLALLGAAIGMTTIDPSEKQNPSGLAIGQGLWLIISGIISLFLAGWMTGILSGAPGKKYGALNALVTWGLVTLMTLYAGTTAIGAILSGGLGILKAGASVAGSAVGAIGQGAQSSGATDSVTNQIHSAFQNLDEADKQKLTSIMNRTVTQGKLSEEDRKTLVDMYAEAANVPPQQADSTIDAWSQTLQKKGSQVKSGAKQAAETASNIAAGALWAIFIMLVLNAFAATIGGSIGAGQREVDSRKETSSTVRK